MHSTKSKQPDWVGWLKWGGGAGAGEEWEGPQTVREEKKKEGGLNHSI